MKSRYRLILLLATMVTAVAVAMGVTITLLYNATLDRQRTNLLELVETQASLIEVLFPEGSNEPGGPRIATPAQFNLIIDPQQEYLEFGETGELALAERRDDMIVFLWDHRHFDFALPRPVPWDSDVSEPMRRALNGESGTIIALDYRGEEVLAAYHPIAGVGLGIVAKLDLAEIQAPYQRASLIAAGAGLLIVIIGFWLMRLLSNPLVQSDKARATIKEKDTALKVIVDSTADGILTITQKGIILSANKRIEEMFGYSSKELIGRNITVLMDQKDATIHDGYLSNYLSTGHGTIIGVGPREITGVHKDGRKLFLDLAVNEILGADGSTFVGSIRDISERITQRDHIQRSQRVEVIGQITGGVAHDFNNILTTILGNLELLDERIRNDDLALKFVKTALRAGHRGAELTTRLLAFSRRQALLPTTVDINVLVHDVIALVNPSMGQGVTLELALDKDLWLVKVDEGQLETSILNLCLNARDAMPDGGVLAIKTENVLIDENQASRSDLKPGEYVKILVGDGGTGMTGEVLERIFEPFFTTKEFGQNSGLGLSNVFGFVTQSEGAVRASSELGLGTEIEILLPVTAEGLEKAKKTEGAHPTGSESIILVEDDPDVMELTKNVLSGLGYKVFAAEDGPSLMMMIDHIDAADLLLSDVVLPKGMRGPAVAAEVEKKFPGIPILFISGYSEQSLYAEGGDKLANFLSKPFTRKELAGAVRNLLDQKNQANSTG
jgi:two-component system, chemotaxis family, CheB/CheR fusion protein